MLKLLLLVLVSLFPCLCSAVSDDEKLNVVAFVMACEDSRSVQTLNNVASVLHTRANGRRTVDALYAVVSERGQFDCFHRGLSITYENKRSNVYVRLGKHMVSEKQFQMALAVAKESLTNDWKPTFFATHFYNPSLCSPAWARNGKFRVVSSDKGHTYMIAKKATGVMYAASTPTREDRWLALNMAVPPSVLPT